MNLPETTSEAADWGTCAHQVAEKCLQGNVDASSFIGTTEKGKKYENVVDDEMADTAQMYVDYIRGRRADYKAKTGKNSIIFVEERFSLASLNPPFEAGGTADCVLIFPEWRLMEVVDLKGGRGVVVEAKGNPQLRTYGLGAVLLHQSAPVDKVQVTIVQPRAGHKDGRIRSEDFHIAELAEWTTDLVGVMKRSALAQDAFKGRVVETHSVDEETGNPFTTHSLQMSDGEWSTTYLQAGSWCKFCKAAGFCPALETKAMDAAGVWFDDLDQPQIIAGNAPSAMSPERAAQMLEMLPMIEEWISSVRAYWHGQAESGVEIPGHQLVDKIGNRSWVDDNKAIAALREAGLTDDQIYSMKLVSPAQAEKALGAKRKAAITDLVERPIRGTNLVSLNKTTRPAATPAAHKHFDILD